VRSDGATDRQQNKKRTQNDANKNKHDEKWVVEMRRKETGGWVVVVEMSARGKEEERKRNGFACEFVLF